MNVGVLLLLISAAPLNPPDRALEAQAGQSVGPQSPPDRARLEAIYQRPRFKDARVRASDAFIQWVRRMLEALLSLGKSRGMQAYANTSRFIILGLAFIAALFGLSRVRRQRDVGHAGRVPLGVKRSGHERSPLLPAADSLERARALLSSSPRESIREALRALLSALEQRQWARADRVTTNREVALGLAQRGVPASWQEELQTLLEGYDRQFYSLDEVQEPGARGFLVQVNDITRRLSERP